MAVTAVHFHVPQSPPCINRRSKIVYLFPGTHTPNILYFQRTSECSECGEWSSSEERARMPETRAKMLERRRAAILELWSDGEGMGQREIARTLKLYPNVVQRVVRKAREQQQPARRGRPRCARTESTIKNVKRKIQRNPERQIRQLGREHKVTTTTMSRLVHKDLGLKSLKKHTAPALPNAAKQRRVNRTQTLLQAAEDYGDGMVYSDEKTFDIHQAFNRQNDRVLAASRRAVPAEANVVPRQKHPASVTVWGAVSADWKSDLVFLDKRISASVYQQEVLQGPVLAASRGHFHRRRWKYTQDGAPAHRAASTIKWFQNKKIPLHHPWPPNSPDLNPLDFYVWNEIQRVACSLPHHSVQSLKEAVQKAWADLPQAQVAKACRSVPKRCRQVIAANGSTIDK